MEVFVKYRQCHFDHVTVYTERIAALWADLKLALLDIIGQMSIWAYQWLFERCWEDVDCLRCRIIYHTRVAGWFFLPDSDAMMQINNYCFIFSILTGTHMQVQAHTWCIWVFHQLDTFSLSKPFSHFHYFNLSVNNVDMHLSRMVFSFLFLKVMKIPTTFCIRYLE